MHLNKEIISRSVVAFIFVGVALGVVVPILLNLIKGKHLGLSKKNHDFDYMIKQQKELLKSQYQINQQATSDTLKSVSKSEAIRELKKEIAWGGNELGNDLRQKINKDFSYQFSENKINSFILLVEKRNYLSYIDSDNNKIDKENVVNFLAALFILLVLIDENKEKTLNFTEKCAKKLKLTPMEIQLAIQLKLLMANKENKIKEERIFVEQLVLMQYSDETIQKSIRVFLENEANLWKKSISHFFEELSLYLTYAFILLPVARPINKHDIQGALKVFDESEITPLEDIKKKYKKLALTFHPDKITPLKLPISLEKKAIQKFNIIQEAYEIINSRK